MNDNPKRLILVTGATGHIGGLRNENIVRDPVARRLFPGINTVSYSFHALIFSGMIREISRRAETTTHKN